MEGDGRDESGDPDTNKDVGPDSPPTTAAGPARSAIREPNPPTQREDAVLPEGLCRSGPTPSVA